MDFPRVQEQIRTLAEHWEKECIHMGHSIYIKASASDDRRWRLPPLMSGSKSDTISLDGLLRDFYYQPSGDVEVLKAWDNAIGFLVNRSRGYPTGAINREFNTVFPEMTFGGDLHHPLHNCAQFLRCASWDRELELKSTRCMVEVGGKRIGFDRSGIFTSTGSHRTRMTIPDFKAPMRCLRGGQGRKPALPETNGAHRLLLRALPHLIDEIEIGFTVAVAMGGETERLIVKQLDVVLDSAPLALPEDVDPIAEARRLIETARGNPLKQLAQLLIPKFGSDRFTKLFGSPYQRASKTYTAHMQQKHRGALETLIDGHAHKAEVVKKTGTDALLSHLFGV